MKHRILLSILGIFCFSLAIAQQTIKGRVVDKITQEPVEGALISTIESSKNKIADKHGNFEIQTTYEDLSLRVTCIGYATQVIKANSNQMITIELAPGIVNLQELVIAPAPRVQFSTISKIDLNLRPIKTSQDLLRIVPGLFIAQHQGGGKAEQIFLRGFDIDHGTDIAISADELPVNMSSHAHGQGYADMHFIIPELVKDIDYGKGPYYASEGNFNAAGNVNIQTINKLDKSRIQSEVGQYNTMRTLAMIDLLSKENNQQNAFIAGEFLYSDGPFKSPQHFNRFNLFGKYNLELNRSNELGFIASTFSSDWSASGQIPERAVSSGIINRFGAIDNSEGGYTGRTNASLKVRSRLNSGAQLENQAYFSHYYFNLFSNFTFYLNDPINGDQIKQRESRNMFGYNSRFTKIKEWKGYLLNTAAGTGFRIDQTDNTELAHTVAKSSTLEQLQKGNIKELNVFFYIDESIQKGNWDLNFATRFDYFHFAYDDLLNPDQPGVSKAIFSPKINFQYKISKALQLFAKAGKGFHSNDTRVVVANKGREILPAAYGTDLGVMWKPWSKLLIKSAAWHLYLQQEFVYVGDEGIVVPSGKTRRYGLDLSARYQVTKKLIADIDLNYCSARDLEGEKGQNYIPLAPTFTSTGGLSYQSKKSFNGSLRYRFIKDRPANEDNSVVARGYFVTDLSVNYTKARYEFGIIVENLFNAKWNEAQFATESRLKNEPAGVTELHFTPGTPFFIRGKFAIFF